MRTRLALLVLLTAAAGLAGCGGTVPHAEPPKGAPTVGPHQGTAFVLPGNAGFVEVVNEPEPAGRDRDASTAVVAYFLMPDARTPLSPAPTAVTLKVDGATGKSETLELKPDPKSGDPAGGARFASRTGPYALSDLRGALTAKVGGSDFKATLANVR